MTKFQQPLSLLFFLGGASLIFLGVSNGIAISSHQLTPDPNFRGVAVFLGVIFCSISIWLYDRSNKITPEPKLDNREPLAYAVLSYVLDGNQNFALLKDGYYKKIQPSGRRLEWGEQPHQVALSIASDELDLPIEELKRFPPIKEERYAYTRIVPSPYQVQLEKNPEKHKKAVAHYDFVYIFIVDRIRPALNVRSSSEGKFEPEWYSLQEVEDREHHLEWGPHDDMLPTMKQILREIRGAT